MFNSVDDGAIEIDELPEDNFGVFVGNKMDEQRLLWLVNVIGEKKLRASVEKYSKRYLGSQPFVSRLLNNYHLKVPTHVFAPINIPFYRVYVLLAAHDPVLKIGVSGNWLGRAQAFADRLPIEDIFDINRSVAFAFYSDKQAALKAENAAKVAFHSMARPRPKWVRYGAGGRKEWFSAEIYEQAVAFIRDFDSSTPRNTVPLAAFLAAYYSELESTEHFN